MSKRPRMAQSHNSRLSFAAPRTPSSILRRPSAYLEQLESRLLLAAIVFPTPTFLTAGTTPTSVVSADFDGDNLLDVAVANFTSNTVSIFRNRGDASFNSKADYTTSIGGSPISIAVGNFNGDNRADLVIANKTGDTLDILLNFGNGTFAAPLTVAVGSPATAVAVADFNGDARSDIAVTRAGFVSIFNGLGNGTFNAKVDYAVNGAPSCVVAADFTGDNRADLAISDSQNTSVSVLLNNGNGTFANRVDYLVHASRSLAAADLNADGKADLVLSDTASSNNTLSVLLNNGVGTFLPKASYSAIDGAGVVATGDLNGDGLADVLLGEPGTAGRVAVYLNKGAGVLAAPVRYYTEGSSINDLAVADFNADGKSDLAVALGGSAGVSVLVNAGGGALAARADYLGMASPVAAASGDFNGDGKIDAAIATTANNSINILLNNGNGTFAAPVLYAAGTQPRSIVSADFNADGKLDLATVSPADDTFSIFLGNGDGTFAPRITVATGDNPVSLAAADFNGDGKKDIVVLVAGSPSAASVYLNGGTGNFSAHTEYAIGNFAAFVTADDISGDGKADIILAAGSIGVLINSGTGTFGTRVDYPVNSFPSSIAVADLNGDGKKDLAVANSLSGFISVLTNKGTGSFNPKVDYASTTNPDSIVAADYNRDGTIDLAATGSGVIGIFSNNGNATFSTRTDLPTAQGPDFLLTADFTGDSRLDLLTLSIQGGTVSTYFNLPNRSPFVSAFNLNVPANTAISLNSADFVSRFTDLDPGDTLQTIRITALPAHGTLRLAGVPVNLNQIVPTAQINSLTYTPTIGYSGADSITWAGSDGNAFSEVSVLLNFTVAPQPNIVVTANATAISTGDTTPSYSDFTDFGYIDVASGSVFRTYTIQNMGNGSLSLTGNPRVIISGANPADFSVTLLPATTLAPGASANFVITFNPTAAGTRTATVSIPSDDQSGAFTFAIRSTGLATTVATSGLQSATITPGSGVPAVSGQPVRIHYTGWLTDGTIFDTTLTGGRPPLEFTLGVSNVILGWQQGLEGMRAGEKRVLILPPDLAYGSLGDGASVPPNATLIYEIDMLSTGPALSISGNSLPITAGDSTPSVADLTDFGTLLPGESITHTFTIISNNPGALVFTALPQIALSGIGESEFTSTTPVLDPTGTFHTFTITYQPSTEGLSQLTVSIPTNNVDIPVYTFAIQGALNLSPSVSSFSITLNQNQTIPFTTNDFAAVFLDANITDTVQKIKITSLPAGTLALSGTPVTLNQEILAADLSNLTYTPVLNYFGSDFFSFVASDGVTYSSNPATVGFNILSTDVTAPTATLFNRDPDSAGSVFQFQIQFSDDVALSSATFAVPSVVFVTASNGFIASATLVSVNIPGDGTSRIATYEVSAPSGSWDASDAGRYLVNIAGGVISDTTGNTLAGGSIGYFYYSPDPLFSERYYITHYTDIAAALDANALSSGYAHYISFGAAEGRNPSLFFNERYYRAVNADVDAAITAGAFTSAFQHYKLYGAADGRQPSLLFDETWYRSNAPDVAAAIAAGALGSGLEHYMRYGQYENRPPSLYFDPLHYLTVNPDVAAAINVGIFISAFDHFLSYGAAEGRAPNAIYNEPYYLAHNSDVAAAVTAGTYITGYEHFLRYGQFDNRRPSGAFDPAFYLATYPEVSTWIASGPNRSAFYHFLVWGRTEGRLGSA